MTRTAMILKLTLLSFVFSLVCLPLGTTAYAQEAQAKTEEKADADKDAKAEDEAKADEDAEEEEDEETLEEKVKDLEKIEGLFTFYRDAEDGSMLMEVSEEQMADGMEFIYHGVVLNGAADIGFYHILGSYYIPEIIQFRKAYDRIEIRQENTNFYFDPDNALAKQPDANIPPALLGVTSIIAKSEDGTRYLIDADALFKGEVFEQISPSMNPQADPTQTFQPGGINSEKTHVVYAKSFPRNSTVAVDYVFDNPAPTVWGSPAVTNPRTITVTFQHSLIAMPEPGFEPRLDDQRVGYFADRVTDLTDTGSTPYRDLINRWRLVKKDPDAELSEPVKPITFWIENTTPVEYRQALVDGVEAWNVAFEAAGFRNAIEAKIMPDDADWDPADVDYNVIRWVSSPNPMYGGIGPSLSNPRTGEIIATDIVLEQVYVNYRLVYKDLFSSKALNLDGLLKASRETETLDERHHCTFGATMQQNTMFGLASLQAQNASPEQMQAVVTQGLMELALHEVGHTLGLMHNMKATQAISYEDIYSPEMAERGYLTGSIMDYTTVNVQPDPTKQPGLYYSVRPGPYDLWAIEFGYRPSLDDPAAEAERVNKLLARSTEKALAFGNDADDMRSPMRGIDPRTMVGDLSDNAIQYGIDRISYIDARMGDLVSTYSKPGQTWDDLYAAYVILANQKASQARVISNYIGGVYLERFVSGQEGGTVPLTPVDSADQRKAMDALDKLIFAPDAWKVPDQLIQHLLQERRGYGPEGVDDPHMHDHVLGFQAGILLNLLNPRTMQRQLDSTLYGNDYGPADVLQDLTDAVFTADLRGRVNSQRQNLQLFYVEQLVGIATGQTGHGFPLQSAALYQLKRIEKMERQGRSPDVATAGHRDHIRLWIEQTLYGDGSRM